MIAIDGYYLIRLGMKAATHGGVYMYIKNSVQYSVVNDSDPTLEALWVKIQSTYLPRGISLIVAGVPYYPPRGENTVMLNYLLESLTSIESLYASCGIIVLGDFNHLRLDIKKLNQFFNLKQIIPFATRGSNLLIITNLQKFYNMPVKRPNFGLSDQATVEVQQKDRVQLPAASFTVQKRDLQPSNGMAMQSYISKRLMFLPSSTLAQRKSLSLKQLLFLFDPKLSFQVSPHGKPNAKKLIKKHQRPLVKGTWQLSDSYEIVSNESERFA